MEYPDVIDAAKMSDAVSLTLELLSRRDEPLQVLAAEAVSRTFCTCVTAGEDAAEGHPSVIHDALTETVVAQASTGTDRTPREERT